MKQRFICLLAHFLFIQVDGHSDQIYGYTENGQEWGKKWPLCSTGQEQSPIDLNEKVAVVSSKLLLSGFGFQDYDNVPVSKLDHTILSNLAEGHIDVEFEDGSSGSFEPIQFHFHSPSEHTLNGEQFALEMHIVHRDRVTKKPAAVVGIFFKISEDPEFENYFLDQIEPGLFDVDSIDDIKIGQLHLATFLKQVDFREFYYYKGSFTTPPCTEGINWFVVRAHQYISRNQFEAFSSHWAENLEFAEGKGNNRAIQKLNKRILQKSKYTPRNVQSNSFLDTWFVGRDEQADQDSIVGSLKNSIKILAASTVDQVVNSIAQYYRQDNGVKLEKYTNQEKPWQIS